MWYVAGRMAHRSTYLVRLSSSMKRDEYGSSLRATPRSSMFHSVHFFFSLMSPARLSLNFRSYTNASFAIDADNEKNMASSYRPNRDLVDVTRTTVEDMDIYAGGLSLENLRIVAEELHVTSVTFMEYE